MYVDGEAFGYTLEDVVRAVKIKGETAIPAGRYQVVLDYSPHFGRIMPHILNVPGFTGIRIHAGNKAADTEGCIMVGWEAGAVDFVGESKVAFAQLLDQIEEASAAREPIWITVEDAA